MIGKIKSGCAPAGLVDYANNEIEKDAKLIDYKDVLTTNNKAMAASFALQSKSNPKVRAFVGHTVLAFSPDDRAKLSDELIVEIARKYMAMMGITDTQYAIFRHYDKEHDHVHIIYNRVNNQGQKLKNDKNFKANIAVCRKLTREYGLTFGEGKEKVNRDRLTGTAKIQYRFYDDIKPIVKEATSWSMFKQMLEEKHYEFMFHHLDEDEDKEIKGISFCDGKNSMSGRKIDRSLTYFAIDRQLKLNATLANAKEVQSVTDGKSSLIGKFADAIIGEGGQSSDSEQAATASMEQAQNAAAIQSCNGSSATDEGIVAAIEDVADGANSAAETAVELLVGAVDIATTMQPSVGGGGGNSSSLTDDEKKRKKKDNGQSRGFHR